METNKERKITYRLDLPLHQRHRHHDVRLLDLRRPTQPEPHAERQQQLALRPEQQHFVAIQHLAEDQPYVPVDPKPIALESKYENGSIYNRYFCLMFFSIIVPEPPEIRGQLALPMLVEQRVPASSVLAVAC